MKIKVLEEDFKVFEEKDLKLVDFDSIEGSRYACVLLKKKGRNTLDVIKEIARRLRKRVKDVGFAGNKDKIAVTEQYVSILIKDKKEVEKIVDNASIKFMGWLKERINLGELKGNRFEIIVRDLDKEFDLKFDKIKNFYGEQRFGIDGGNVEIGKAFVKRDFSKVCELLGISVEGRDFIGMLRKEDLRKLRLYVGAYQSWLWNKVAKEVENLEELEAVGFLTEFKDSKVEEIYKRLMDEEGIVNDSFLINEFKELSVEGDKRKLYLDVQDFSYEWADDEIFDGKKRCKLFFKLGKGSYATVFVKNIFNFAEKDI
jgi:tRNA(Glu) U13 pseudouridine synthase TruD